MWQATSRKAREMAHPPVVSLDVPKNKPALYFAVKVAHPPDVVHPPISQPDLEPTNWLLLCLPVRYSPFQTVEELVVWIYLRNLLQSVLGLFELD